MNARELELTLIATLDALTESPKLKRTRRAAGIDIAAVIKRSEAGDERYNVRWRDQAFRPFAELVPIAQREGVVNRDLKLRGVTIAGEPQFVRDPALLKRFGEDADSKDMAEMNGYPQYPWALDVDGNKIPLLSARFPRPQRQHRPHPHSGNARTGVPKSPPRDSQSVSNNAAPMRDKGENAAGDLPLWHRSLRTPVPVEAPAPIPLPNALSDYIKASKANKQPTPLRADLERHLHQLKERGPAHPRPINAEGRPTIPKLGTTFGADDPPERGA